MGEAVNRLEWRVIWELGFMEQGMGVKGSQSFGNGQGTVMELEWQSHGMVLASGWKYK
jgi:hypothetical protein